MDNSSAQQIGESQIGTQQMQQTTPDMMTPQGGQQLFSHLAKATLQKEKLDFILKGIADKVNAGFSSRIKNPQTVVQKIAQKRLQGRKYDVQDVNDPYGARIVVKDEKQFPEVKKYLQKASDIGLFKIHKSEMVDSDYHKAWHMDFSTSDGTRGEIQILTPQEEANSMVNHDLRSTFGEKLEGPVKKLADMQKEKVSKLPDNKAAALSKAIGKIHQATVGSGQPLPPQVNAQALASIA